MTINITKNEIELALAMLNEEPFKGTKNNGGFTSEYPLIEYYNELQMKVETARINRDWITSGEWEGKLSWDEAMDYLELSEVDLKEREEVLNKLILLIKGKHTPDELREVIEAYDDLKW